MKDWIAIEKKIPLTKHKYFNFQIGWWKINSVFGINTYWSVHQDHAGFHFEADLLWFYFIFYTYDNRHWCNKCNKYMTEHCYEENHE
jgi:hypothetical protein